MKNEIEIQKTKSEDLEVGDYILFNKKGKRWCIGIVIKKGTTMLHNHRYIRVLWNYPYRDGVRNFTCEYYQDRYSDFKKIKVKQ